MPPPAGPVSRASVQNTAPGPDARASSASSRSGSAKKRDPSQQLSQIEKSVTHLLIATKQLLETLTQWSRHTATETEVSDVYVRLGYEFNIACRAFTSIGVETTDLGPVPELLRSILEETLSQEASPASLDRFLPRIRDIIINLLHGLKRKQQRLRSRQAKENPAVTNGQNAPTYSRQMSVSSSGSAETGLTQMLEDVPQHKSNVKAPERKATGISNANVDEPGIPARTSSAPNARFSDRVAENMENSSNRSIDRDARPPLNPSLSSSSMSSSTMQNLPILSVEDFALPIQTMSPVVDGYRSAPSPPPKQQDALAALQRGGDLERRASRRYSAYQISKHLGASPNGVPMMPPPAQNSPIPNRGRDVRESLNAVRTRGSLLPSRQKSVKRFGEFSPSRTTAAERSFEEGATSKGVNNSTQQEVQDRELRPAKTSEDQLNSSVSAMNDNQKSKTGVTLVDPQSNSFVDDATGMDYTAEESGGSKYVPEEPLRRQDSVINRGSLQSAQGSSDAEIFRTEQSPRPGKELTLFLQYKTKIKKYVLPDGSTDLTIARLQLAFIEKFAWNTHSNGNDLPEIYIQDPVSGVRHELEDLTDVKDRSVLVLNVEVLDEVKRHIDEGLGGLRRMVEGVRSAVDGQQTFLQQVSERQEVTAKDITRLATLPPSIPTRSGPPEKSNSMPRGTSDQIREVQSLRRDLAVVRQTFTSFAAGISSSTAAIRAKASTLKAKAVDTTIPVLDGDTGRTYVEAGKKAVGDESENVVSRVDDLQDMVEDLRRDVVSRGVRPLPRQLENVSRDISAATTELKKLQAYVKREKPIWTKIWEKELETVCNDREFLTLQEELVADLEDDLEKATQTFALVEQATKQQNIHAVPGVPTISLRSTSRGLSSLDGDVDPVKAKDGVLGEVRALQPNHETRLEAIERAEKARQRELESRREGPFKKELGSFVEQGKLRKSGGVEEAERLRKLKDERARREGWEGQEARLAARAEKEKEKAAAASTAAVVGTNGAGDDKDDSPNEEPNRGKEKIDELPEITADSTTITGTPSQEPVTGTDDRLGEKD